MSKIRERFQRLNDIERAAMDAASIVETLCEYRDIFDRAHARVIVEFSNDFWCTFARPYSSTSESVFWTQHNDRETARNYARNWLANR
jgi:hypothetical protein